MKKFLFFTLIITVTLLFWTSCSQKHEKQLLIATNSWIGYTPLFYAKERGYLKKLNMDLLTNVSLAEAADVYNIGKADLVTTTQHEYYSLKQSNHNIVPIILFDRSYGGDMILSNKSIETIKKAKKIYAYLEIDSINSEILKDFIRYYHLDSNKIVFINKDQAQIEDLQPNKEKDILIVTYVPYSITLLKKGFQKLASTRDTNKIIVIDALCSSKKILQQEHKRLQKLKRVIDRSVNELQNNTRVSYQLVKNYLGNISYKEYTDSLQLIKWINKPSEKLLKRIEPMGYKKEDLIQ